MVKDDKVDVASHASSEAKQQRLILLKTKAQLLFGPSAKLKWPLSTECKSWNNVINFKHTWTGFHAMAIVMGACIMFPSSAYPVDMLKTWTCLIGECRPELARCVADPSCAANLVCLETCKTGPGETECQLKCGDLFENSVVDQFNDCVISRKRCVAQKSDDGHFPMPLPCALVPKFETTDFVGKWFITSGLNPSFDTFDCQVHDFFATTGKLQANFTWRVNTPDGGFITRKTVQNLVQDTKQPAILHNHNNELLHYSDDWYILSSKIENQPDDYVLVYYKGTNDAWDGYGGAVVYTRSRTLPSSIIPALKASVKRLGLNFEDFKMTDNSCNPEAPLLARIGKKVVEGEQAIVKNVEKLVGQVLEKVENVSKAETPPFQEF